MTNHRVESPRKKPTILTLTFPPDDNPNYGGILQAWALQQAFAQVDVDTSVGALRLGVIGRARRVARRFLARATALTIGRGRVTEAGDRLVEIGTTAPILRFSRKIRMAGVFDAHQRVLGERARGYAAYVVGSDQVWRPDYASTTDFMLGFLGGDTAPRFSYAPSFGHDDPGFSRTEVDRLRPLIERFDGLSVRESSAVKLVERLWGAEANRLIDPTMLLTPDQYLRLTRRVKNSSGTEHVVSYVLDATPETREIANALQSALGRDAIPLLPRRARTYSEYFLDRTAFRRPSIEEWIHRLASAQFIITDSFHGCVFSALFNVPFAVILNERRGVARFETLLERLGLRDRVIRDSTSAQELADRQVDWHQVNEIIDSERQRGFEYLQRIGAATDA